MFSFKCKLERLAKCFYLNVGYPNEILSLFFYYKLLIIGTTQNRHSVVLSRASREMLRLARVFNALGYTMNWHDFFSSRIYVPFPGNFHSNIRIKNLATLFALKFVQTYLIYSSMNTLKIIPIISLSAFFSKPPSHLLTSQQTVKANCFSGNAFFVCHQSTRS